MSHEAPGHAARRASEEAQYQRDLMKDRAGEILNRLQGHIQSVDATNDQFILDGIVAAQHLLKSDPTYADKYDERYETINWEGDYPPKVEVTKTLATFLYKRREGLFGKYGKLETPCHICGGTNTADAPVETDRQGVKVSYVGCHDCKMVIGDC